MEPPIGIAGLQSIQQRHPAPPQKPPSKKPKPAGIGAGISVSARPTTPPDAELAKHGFMGSPQELDHRVGAVREAYHKVKGVDPPAGLAWDVARSQVRPEEFWQLFSPLGLTKTAARAAGIGAAVGAYQPLEQPKFEPIKPRDALYYAQHPERDPSVESVYTASYHPSSEEIKAAGFSPGILAKVNDYLSPAPHAAQQVVTSLAYSPFGVYILGRAAALDTIDAEHGDFRFSRSRNMAKQMGQGFVNDFRHPETNAGNLFLDLLGVVTVGAGTVARAGAVGRAVSEGAGARAVARAAIRRPEPGTFTFRVGEGAATSPKALRLERKVASKEKQLARIKNPKAFERHRQDLANLRTQLKAEKATLPDAPTFEADKLLSGNPAVRAVQKVVYTQLEKRIAARQASDRVPAAMADSDFGLSTKQFYDHWLAGETRLAREQQAARRVEQASQLAILSQLRKTVGYSSRSARAYGRIAEYMLTQPFKMDEAGKLLPGDAKFGLTRGENKAIQVLAVAEPVSAWENLHNTMIRDSAMWSKELNIDEELFIKSHEQHLADLKLAKRVLENPDKQSARFLKAAELAKEVSDEMTRMKVEELGLSPFTGVQRVRSQAAVVRTGKPVGDVAITAQKERAAVRAGLNEPIGATEVSGGANPGIVPASELLREPTRPFGDLPQGFYSPFVSPRNARVAPKGTSTYNSRGSAFGFSPPVDIPELNHIFTGDSILAGDFSINAASLIGDSYAKTVRVASLWGNYKQLLAASRARPPVRGTDEERYMVPIRKTRTIPPALRALMAKIDEGTFTEKDAAALGDDSKAIIQKMFPEGAPADEVRWVDERLAAKMIGGLASQTTGPGQVFYTANELVRLPILFLRPAYILNLLGNVGMGLIHQGAFLGPNLIRGLFAETKYGERSVATMDALVGNSRSLSYINPDVRGLAKHLTTGSQHVAGWWNKVADQHMRRAAFIYEAQRKGYKTSEQMDSLLHDAANAKDRMEVTRRANKGMVEFDNLTRFEKMWLRNLIFVYPWVSRSAVWSVRTIVEHPIKTDVLAHLGEPANYDNEPLVKMAEKFGEKVPAWFKQAGYFPVAFKANGDPMVVSGRTINTFSTLADLVHPFSGMYKSGADTTSFEDLLGPVPTTIVHAVTGRDRFGNPYKGGRVLGAAKEQFASLPQTSAVKRLNTKPAPPGSAPKSHPTFVPGLWDAYGPLIGSVMWPREADRAKLETSWLKEQDPTVRVEEQIQAVRAVAKVQAQTLGKSIPANVKQGLDLLAERMRARAKWAEDNGRTPGSRLNRSLDIQVLAKQGLITPEVASKLRRELVDAKSDTDFNKFGAKLDKQYLGGNALEQWHSDVNTVMAYEKTYGLDYGRHFLDVTNQQNALLKAAFSATKATGEQSIAFAKLATFEEAQDHPVSINGHEYPSVIREAWKKLSPEDKQQTLAKKAGQPWEFLSTFDKQLLTGTKPQGQVAKGWENFIEFRQQAKDKQPAGHKTFPPGYLDQLARYVDRYYAKGFYRDYLTSKQPLVQRLMLGGFVPGKLATPLEDSPNRDLWLQVLTPAGQYAKMLASGDYKKSEVRDTWKQYVESSLLPWARSHPAMKKELDLYGADFLYNLLS